MVEVSHVLMRNVIIMLIILPLNLRGIVLINAQNVLATILVFILIDSIVIYVVVHLIKWMVNYNELYYESI